MVEVVNVTKDPRCPQHPTYQVHCGMGGTVSTWVCSVCYRTLGAASIGDERMWSPDMRHWPRNRVAPPSTMHWNAIDWDYVYREVGE